MPIFRERFHHNTHSGEVSINISLCSGDLPHGSKLSPMEFLVRDETTEQTRSRPPWK
jgi:hypothetical protein